MSISDRTTKKTYTVLLIFLISAFTLFAQSTRPPMHHGNEMNPYLYHGRYQNGNLSVFEPVWIETLKNPKGDIELNIMFSTPLNPASIRNALIIIDDKPVSPDFPFRFSKDGSKLSILLNEHDGQRISGSTLTIGKFESFCGVEMKEIKINSLEMFLRYKLRRNSNEYQSPCS